MNRVRRGECWPAGRHGGKAAVAGDAYGVVGSYVAALVGFGPRDLRGWRKAGCLAFAAVSPPIQFMPWMIAAARKHAERRIVARVGAEIAGATREPAHALSRAQDGESRLPAVARTATMKTHSAKAGIPSPESRAV